MHKRFKKINKKFKNAKKKINKRFNKMNKKFKNLNKKIDDVNNNMRNCLNHMQKTSRNFLRIKEWKEIYFVRLFNSHDEIQISNYFSRNVKHFWKLKDSTQNKSFVANFVEILRLTTKIINRLMYFIRFYKIQKYEEWDKNTNNFEEYNNSNNFNENTNKSLILLITISLKKTIRSNFEIAHRALNTQLKLMYNEIQKFMKKVKKLSQN